MECKEGDPTHGRRVQNVVKFWKQIRVQLAKELFEQSLNV